MKKKLIILLTLFTVVLGAMADNTVSVSTALIPKGKTGTFSIDLANTDYFASSMEVHITFPEGITFERVSLSDRFTDNPSIGTNANGQSVKITTLSSSNDTIKGDSGPLLFITVSADESLEVGEKLVASVTNMELAKKVGDKHEKFNPEPFEFEMEITDRVILDENSVIAPTAQSNVNVLMKRTIKKDVWNTIVLPFTLTKAKAEAAFGSDVQLAEFKGFEVDYGDDEDNVIPLGITINFSTVTMNAKKGMTGGKPFLIKTSQDIESFEADNVTIVGSVSDIEVQDEYDTPGKMTGSYVRTTIPKNGLFITNNKFWYSTGKTVTKAFRCWFRLAAVLDEETDFDSPSLEAPVLFTFDNQPTKIDARTMREIETGRVYNLAGQYIGEFENMDQLPKGIYIVNGKKIVK